MSTPSPYRCPQCGDDDCLMALVPTAFYVNQHDATPRLEDNDTGSPSFSEATEMYCTKCYHQGQVSDFDTTGADWADLGPNDPEPEPDDPLPDDDFPPVDYRCPQCNSDSIIGIEQPNGTRLPRCLDCGTTGYYYQFYPGDHRHPFTTNPIDPTI